MLEENHRLRVRDPKSFARYVFWRWYTRVNVIELALVVLLACCCLYQCFELLEEYYTYPTGIIMKNKLNDEFRVDLPGVTICDNNRVSKASLKRNFPYLNETHYLAIAQGTFYSVNNFSVIYGSDDRDSAVGAILSNATGPVIDWLDSNASSSATSLLIEQINLAEQMGHKHNSNHSEHHLQQHQQQQQFDPISQRGEINWDRVLMYLTRNTPARLHLLAPQKSIIDSLVCANIFGDIISCDELAQVPSVQEASRCTTLFHDSALWDSGGDSRVRELEAELEKFPVTFRFGADELSDIEFLEFDRELEARQRAAEERRQEERQDRLRVTMDNMEVVRMRIDFQADDYANPRALLGGKLAIHSSSVVGESTHKVYRIEPGNWYTYYIERQDYQRLPPPYSTQCYDYNNNRQMWSERVRWLRESREHIYALIKRQAKQRQLIPEYLDTLRYRAMGKRECLTMCIYELSAMTCGCWFTGAPYVPSARVPTNIVDYNGTLPWCRPDNLKAARVAQNLSIETVGDDMFYQICSHAHTKLCVESCPVQCYYSSFEVIQQFRSWPSYESRRYFEDKRIWPRLKHEAECCATISIIYSTPTSISLTDEPKYTPQDMLTIISGNIEAWLGLSAVYAYLFLEHVYDALLEAQLIGNRAHIGDRGATSSQQGTDEVREEMEQRWLSHYLNAFNSWGSNCFDVVLGRFVALLGLVISILTKVRVKLTKLFTYLLHAFSEILKI